MCSVPKAHNVTAQGNALGNRETNVRSPNGAIGSLLLITPFQGSAARSCMCPGAMPQAFTLCRVAAKRIGNASRGEGPQTGERILATNPTIAQPKPVLQIAGLCPG